MPCNPILAQRDEQIRLAQEFAGTSIIGAVDLAYHSPKAAAELCFFVRVVELRRNAAPRLLTPSQPKGPSEYFLG